MNHSLTILKKVPKWKVRLGTLSNELLVYPMPDDTGTELTRVENLHYLWLTYLCLLDSSTSLFGKVNFQFRGHLVSFIIKIPGLDANSVDLDQTPHSAASYLYLHCLPMSLLWDARHMLVKETLYMPGGFYLIFQKERTSSVHGSTLKVRNLLPKEFTTNGRISLSF